MNKTSGVIGFFFAVLFSCTTDIQASVIASGKLFPTHPLEVSREAPSAKIRDAYDNDNRWLLLYAGIVFVLAVLSLYLLFHLKKKQATGKRLLMLQTERMVLFNNAPCGYHATDEEGVFTNLNDTMLHWLGYERDELVGKVKFTALIDGDDPEVSEKLDRLKQGKAARMDLTLLRKSGEKFPVILSMVNIEGLSADPSKRLFSTIDNTRCHEALERIKNLDQELEAFSYSISHDLRAPLRSIDGYSKILQEDYAGQLDDEGRRVLNVVMNNARRMGKLIDDMLDFGRLGRKAIQRSQVNMTAMVKSIVQDLTAQESGRKIEVRFGDLLPAPADPDMIRQVWFNLIDNAVKYTGKKEVALINIESYPEGDKEIRYEVKDNGVGFDMQYAGKLFGVFQRLHKMQDFSGTGVGLAIVKRIITRHGGRVWAEASLNDGATFFFTLPIEHENN